MVDQAGTVRLAIAQGVAVVGDIDANMRELHRLVAEAAEAGAELVVTPELFATGYDPARAAASDGAAIRAQLSEVAREFGVALVASTVDEAGAASEDNGVTEGEAVRRFISASFFTPAGDEIARVRKRHLFDIERDYFTPAKLYGEIVHWQGLNFGLGICYDVEFPEFGRSQAKSGAQILLVPTAVPTVVHQQAEKDSTWSYSASQTSTLMVPSRALENGVVIAYANHSGPNFTGHSCIANPFGRNAAVIESRSGIAIVAVGASAIADARALNPYLQDLARLSD